MKKLFTFFCLFSSVFYAYPLLAAGLLSGADVEFREEKFIKKVKKLKAKSLSDLVHLAPFSDVVVIQRRFMPKTGRLSLSSSASFVLSSEFFFNPGLEAHLAYHFLEKHGIEVTTYYAFSFRRAVTKFFQAVEIKANEINPITNGFVGITYKWMPVYGKISYYDRKILSFDTFLSFGGGMSTLSVRNSHNQIVWEPTMVAGIGQVFAINRDLGFRWDLRWHFTYRLTKDPVSSFLTDFPVSIGLIYYYPSAGSR